MNDYPLSEDLTALKYFIESSKVWFFSASWFPTICLFETIAKGLVHKRELEVNTLRRVQLSVGPFCSKLNCLTIPALQDSTVGNTNWEEC